MAAGATTGVVALAQVDQRSPVLVAASDLSAGHVLTPEDVRVVELAGAEGLSTVSDPAQVVGSVLALPVAEGGLLSQEIVGADGSQLAANEVAISAQLGPGRVPSSVRTGSQVVVVITGDDEGDISLSRAGFIGGSEPTLRLLLPRPAAGRSRPRTPLAGPGRSLRADGGG